MSDKSGYVGRIKNGGTQVVKAPNQQTTAASVSADASPQIIDSSVSGFPFGK